MEDGLFPDVQRRSYWELLESLVPTEMRRGAMEIDWAQTEADIGVTLPRSFKEVSNIFTAGILGSGIYWSSPTTDRSDYRFDRETLVARSQIDQFSPFPLFPAMPGYIVFACTTVRFELAYRVELRQFGEVACDAAVSIIECANEDLEQTGIEVDEMLYRAITNVPPLRGEFSSKFHEWFFADSSFPLFRSVE